MQLELSGPKLKLALESLVARAEEQGGVEAYVQALKVYEVEPAAALVVSDDFMLPFGRLRLRDGGSSGGHNGLKSIEEALASQAYPRLRLGIGPVPPPAMPPASPVPGCSSGDVCTESTAARVTGRWRVEQGTAVLCGPLVLRATSAPSAHRHEPRTTASRPYRSALGPS